MKIKTKSLKPNKLEPIRAQCNNRVVQPIRCTSAGELMVHQINQLPAVAGGVNRKNKDGILALGDDGKALRNIRVDPDGTVVTRNEQPVNVIPRTIQVEGTVSLKEPVECKPITVANIPTCVRVQENLNVVPVTREVNTYPFHFVGREFELNLKCHLYTLYFSVSRKTFVEILGITGEMYVDEFKLNLFPMFLPIDKLTIKTREHVEVGGYILYEN